MAQPLDFTDYQIAAIVPAFRVERDIESVLCALPPYLKHVIVVDDASPDRTAELVTSAAVRDSRVELLRHEHNQGVGGSMLTGFRRCMELGAQVVVKIDGDGQMDISRLPDLIAPLVLGKADYTKGNRFRDFAALRQMPLIRRIGNMGLAFLAKAATGYWNLFDPTNGFLAIRGEMLEQLPLDEIDHSYFFETSMLANLYLLGAVVQDVPMPARYKGEVSSLLIHRVLFEFPPKLFVLLCRRALLKNFIYDFSMITMYLIAGLPLLLFGIIYGGLKWIQYARLAIPAPTGTVILPTLCVLLGIQLLLSAIESDLRSVPRQPLTGAL